jgi:competence protein ComEC
MLPLLSRLLKRDPLFFVAWAALGGICLASGGMVLSLAAGVPIAIVMFAGGIRWRWPWLCVLSAGVLFLSWTNFRRTDASVLAELWSHDESRTAEVEGTVMAAPQGLGDRSRVTMRVRRIKPASSATIVEPLLIDVLGPLPASRLGDRIRASGMLTPLAPPRNPEERSNRGYAKASSGVVAELKVASRFRFHVIGVDWGVRPLEWAGQAREALSRTISRGLPAESEEVALLNGMVLGVTGDISPESTEAFQRSGGMHIFSVSGLHVGIFGTVAWLILRLIGVSRRPAIAVILVLGGAYAFVTGLQAPAVRAAIMLGVFLGGFVIRRQPRVLNSAGIAALGILAFDPAQAFGIGFQLSFAVMVAIGVLGEKMHAISQRCLAPDPFLPVSLVPEWRRQVHRFGQYFAGIVCLSAAAFVGSWLLLWWYFGTVTPAGLVANCGLIPLSWGVMALATLSMLLKLCALGGLSVIVNRMNFWAVSVLKQTAALFAALPGGHFELSPLSDYMKAAEHPLPEVVVFDAGYACGPQVVRAEDEGRSRFWMIDCGDHPGYLRGVRPWLRRRAGREIDGLVLTHAEKAHTGAYSWLRKDFEVRRTIVSALPDPPGSARPWKPFAEAVSAGNQWRLGPETGIEVLFPPPGFPPQSRVDDQCLVLLISIGPWRILSMADSGFSTEKWLLQNRPGLTADVLVMGRHGSDYCGLPEFVRSGGPRAVVATSAEFPEGEEIPDAFRKELAQAGIELFDQGRCGAVEMWREGGRRLVLRGFVDGKVMRLGTSE